MKNNDFNLDDYPQLWEEHLRKLNRPQMVDYDAVRQNVQTFETHRRHRRVATCCFFVVCVVVAVWLPLQPQRETAPLQASLPKATLSITAPSPEIPLPSVAVPMTHVRSVASIAESAPTSKLVLPVTAPTSEDNQSAVSSYPISYGYIECNSTTCDNDSVIALLIATLTNKSFLT